MAASRSDSSRPQSAGETVDGARGASSHGDSGSLELSNRSGRCSIGAAGTPKKRRAIGRGTRDRMLAAQRRLTEATSGVEGRGSGDKGAVAESPGEETLLQASLAPAVSLTGPFAIGGVGGCTDRCGAEAAVRPSTAVDAGRAFKGKSAARVARSRFGKRAGVRT